MKRLTKAIEIATLCFGLALLGSCTAMGIGTAGAYGGVGAFILSLVVAGFLVGFVFIVTRTNTEVNEISGRLGALQESLGAQRTGTKGPPTGG